MNPPITEVPLWGVFVGTLLLVLASVEAGFHLARMRQKERDREKEAPVGAMAGATLGLLAFLLAITFGLAADAFHARKVALVDETSAIRMTYLLAGTTPEPQRTEIRTVLREYVDQRLRWADGQKDGPGQSDKELLDRLWRSTAAVQMQQAGQVDVFLSYAGRIFELQAQRTMVRERSRIPGTYWAVLYVVAALALAAMGYHVGIAGTERSPALLAVAIAFSAVMMVIADLDRPGEGFVNVTQEPMVDLRKALHETKG